MTWLSQISRTLLSIEQYIFLFIKIVSTKLRLLKSSLELKNLYLINSMSGIMEQLMLME